MDYERFLEAVKPATGRDVASNKEQESIVSAPLDRSIKVVAGPGSGKTTVIVLRLLKLIFVDCVSPKEIIATTFTVKASKELKSRILSWGIAIRRELLPKLNSLGDVSERDRIKNLNFDLIKIGTIDAIAQETLTDECRADQDPPIVVEEFITKHLMVHEWFEHYDDQAGCVEELTRMGFDTFRIGSPGKPAVSGVIGYLMDFHSRMSENSIDPNSLIIDYPHLGKILADFNQTLLNKKLLDFPMLEKRFLKFVNDQESDKFFEKIKVLMVDEYQDTNLLQESIYGGIVKRISQKNGCFIAVGDDDQSIYRFRGSRVYLFADIEQRFKQYGVDMITEFLCVNYRSTRNIVEFCNKYISNDKIYQEVRVKDKPDMSIARTDCENFPVFGIFRDNLPDLARDIAKIVYDFTYKGSYTFVDTEGKQYLFEKSPGGGPGDLVLLMSSTANLNFSGKNERLPKIIGDVFKEHEPVITPFNPRGDRLCENPDIARLVGTLIRCIDPDFKLANAMKLDNRAKKALLFWMDESEYFIKTVPEYNGVKLETIVNAWATGTSYPKPGKWTKTKVTVLDILYNLLPWFCRNRSDAECMVNTQAFFNAISSAAIVKGDELVIKFEKDTHLPTMRSVNELYRLVIRPLLEDTLDIDETLFFSISSENRFNIMTIHQAKGLEFPITFVDVCSDFSANNVKQRVKRFPETNDDTSILEKVLSKYCPAMQQGRSELDQQFDDLTRKHFVAFSRAQDVLILVGLTKSLTSPDKLKNVALGWTRDGNWTWKYVNEIKMKRL